MARSNRSRNHTLALVNDLRQRAITQARAEHPLSGASLGWDDASGRWWAKCDDCNVPKHFTLDLDVASATVARHNANKHQGGA
jgi:hypothetical protein